MESRIGSVHLDNNRSNSVRKQDINTVYCAENCIKYLQMFPNVYGRVVCPCLNHWSYETGGAF